MEDSRGIHVKNSMQFFSTKFFIYVVLILAIAFSWFGYQWYKFLHTPLIPAEGQAIVYVFKSGYSIKKLAKDLHHLGILPKPQCLLTLAYWHVLTTRLQAGEYQITAGILPSELLRQIAEGKVVVHDFTIVEGWSFQQLMAALNANHYIQHTLANATPEAIMAKLGYSQTHPEGVFFPATYHFKLGVTDVSLLQLAYQTMEKHLNAEWVNRAPELPYQKPYEALIVASLIEKETARPDERPLVAGVILQRLKKNMRLQIDPTVIYGLGASYQGKLTKAHLSANSPYNTYTHTGLPPTPIAMPGLYSIKAALHPIEGTALYFVAKGHGMHYFSSTLQQHNGAVIKYLHRASTNKAKVSHAK